MSETKNKKQITLTLPENVDILSILWTETSVTNKENDIKDVDILHKHMFVDKNKIASGIIDLTKEPMKK